MLFALATVIVLVSVSSEKAKLQCATMLPLLEVGTLIKESLIKGEPLFMPNVESVLWGVEKCGSLFALCIPNRGDKVLSS